MTPELLSKTHLIWPNVQSLVLPDYMGIADSFQYCGCSILKCSLYLIITEELYNCAPDKSDFWECSFSVQYLGMLAELLVLLSTLYLGQYLYLSDNPHNEIFLGKFQQCCPWNLSVTESELQRSHSRSQDKKRCYGSK